MNLLSIYCSWAINLERQALARDDFEAASYWDRVSMRLLIARTVECVTFAGRLA